MKPIWHSLDISLDQLNEMTENTMGTCLGMEFTEIGPDYLRIMMPVDHRTVQPYGLLHGGASAALAETVGSVASSLIIDPQKQIGAVILMQMLPFYDEAALRVLNGFEERVYRNLR